MAQYHIDDKTFKVDGKTIAIDSFKMRAQNSLKNNFNQRKVKRHIDYIDKKIAQ